jgi:hypothetical protein
MPPMYRFSQSNHAPASVERSLAGLTQITLEGANQVAQIFFFLGNSHGPTPL